MKKVVVIFLWGLIILAFIFSLRSSMVASQLVNRFQESMPPEQVKEQTIAGQFARDYIKEWLAINEKEKDNDRESRLQMYNNDISSSGVVEVENNIVPGNVTVTKCKKEEDGYLVDTTVNSDEGPLALQVKVAFSDDNKPYIKSPPLFVNFSGTSGNINKNLYREKVSDELRSFVKSFLEAYCEGKNVSETSVYTKNNNIMPAGNTEFVKLTRVRGNLNNHPDIVEASYEIKFKGNKLEQYMMIELEWQGGKPLVRNIKI